jgi:hypothetical protein
MKKIKRTAAQKRRHEYYLEHLERAHELSRKYYLAHKAECLRARRLLAQKHIPEHREYMRKFRLAHPEKIKEYHRKFHRVHPEANRKDWLQHQYGISLEQFDQMFAAQNGCCAICKKPFQKVPHIDHDHQTGKIRNLLCTQCNSGLGFFKDCPSLLQDAIKYLEAHETVSGEDS